MSTDRMAETGTDTAKALVPSAVHITRISHESKAPSITDDKPKAKRRRAVDAVHDPSVSTKDICVQLEIPIEDDPRTDLETFSRFKRLGRFNDAKEFFDTQLDNFRTTPYIFVQYAEMLFAAGDLNGFRQLVYPDDFFHIGTALPNNELAANFELMKFLAQPLLGDYPAAIMQVVRTIFTFLKTETLWGSTEIQLYTLCLQVIKLMQNSSGQAICPEDDDCQVATDITNWSEMYIRLLGEHRIWDFRDLFVTTISVYGWQRTASLIFGPRHIFDILEGMNQDWRQSQTDESMVLGLLDLFTSLILQNSATEKRQITELLCIYSRSLAETIQTISLEHMKTRPFIQWILAKTLAGMSAIPQCSDGRILEDFPGLLIDLGDNGVHLPIFVPVRHSEKPDWDMFRNQANAAEIRSIEVAIQAATDIGDYALQSLGLKILVLHSKDPGGVLEALASLQLSKLGDREGFLQTCLSKYLTLRHREDEENLLESFKKVENSSKGFQNKSFIHPTFLWARDVICGHLEAQTLGELEKSAVWWLDLDAYSTKLPRYVVDFVNQNLGSTLSSSKRSISAMQLGKGAAQSEQTSEDNQISGARNRHDQGRQANREGPMPTSGNFNFNHPSAFNYLESDSALASLLYAPKAPVHTVNSLMNPHGCAEGQPDNDNHSGIGARPFVERVDSAPTDNSHALRLKSCTIKDTATVQHTSDQIAINSDSCQSDDGGELITSVRINEGLPELDFSPSLLDSNTLTVTITSKTDPTISNIYVVDKNGVAKGAMHADIEPSTKLDDTQPQSRKVDDSDNSQSDDGSKLSTSIRVNKGWPKLEFSPSLLDNNTLTVTLTSKTDPTKSTIFVVDENGVAQSAMDGNIEPPTKIHDAQPDSQKVELGSPKRTTPGPGKLAGEAGMTPRKVSNPVMVKDRRLTQDRLPHALRRQHQRDENLASQLKIQQTEAEATQLRGHQMAFGHNDRTGYIPGSPVPLRPITRTLSDRFQLNQGIVRTSSWPTSMPPTAEYDSHWYHKRMTRESSKTRDSSKARDSSKTRNSSKTRAARRARISKEVLDLLNEESVSKNRRRGSVTAYNDPNSAEHSVVDGYDLNMENLETLSDEVDQEDGPALLESIPDRMKGVPQPPSRRKVQINEGQHERTIATAVPTAAGAAKADSKERTGEGYFKTPFSMKAKGKEEKASQVRGLSEPGTRRKPMSVSIQTEEEDEKEERNEQVKANIESAEQEGRSRKEEEAKLAKEMQSSI
ncbi:unnamed protein product [Sordaria macrospora k-hell]|uniref:WGS project CABT00000000 data, contig 2.1 n=1 Tax=Sordaria macrospora (strain ATCC MYA-333 / DSM 997 / K(L3346) / K-hell) TaxID=771870 RepID=F7VL81_SORMK|nr:uncharacterized protein SMAC_00475 [Sordaria macrospora k-hell]CCC06258.1 unnamed protein product [Sordaria macrospora k-hell]